MAIVQEKINDKLIRSYSDAGMKIHGGYPEGDYDEAVDPIDAGRTYTETDIPIDVNTTEASIDDYQAALHKLGVDMYEEA